MYQIIVTEVIEQVFENAFLKNFPWNEVECFKSYEQT